MFWIKGNGWRIVPLSVIAVCSLLAARAAGQLLAARAARRLALAPRVLAERTTTPAPRFGHRSSADTIAGRNIFCSGCSTAPEPPLGPAEEPRPTALPLALLATLVPQVPASADHALALVRGPDGTHLVARDESVHPEVTIEAIEQRRIWLRSGGLREYLALDAEAAGRRPSEATRRGSPRIAGLPESIARGIVSRGPGRFEIRRQVRDRLLARPTEALAGARFLPRRGGGFAIHGVRPGSVWAAIGLRSGDVIARVNGTRLSNPTVALELYPRLRSASRLLLGLRRHGKPVELELVFH